MKLSILKAIHRELNFTNNGHTCFVEVNNLITLNHLYAYQSMMTDRKAITEIVTKSMLVIYL